MLERCAAATMAASVVLIYIGTSESDHPLRELALVIGIMAFVLSAAVLL